MHRIVLGMCAILADESFRIDDKGHLRPLDLSNIEDVSFGPNLTPAAPERSSQGPTMDAGASAQEATEKIDTKKDLILDRDLYRTYFQTMSRPDLILFFGLGVIFAFSVKFLGLFPCVT